MNALEQVSPDSIVAELREIFAKSEYNWQRVRDPWAWVRRLWNGMAQWFGDLYQDHPVIYVVLVSALVTVLIAVTVHFVVLIIQALRPRARRDRSAGVGIANIRDARWYRREATRLDAEGHLPQALAMRFFALVLDLDRRGVVVFSLSKTPIEYVHEAKLAPEGRDRFRALVHRLYAHLYGGEPLTRDLLRDFDRQTSTLIGPSVT